MNYEIFTIINGYVGQSQALDTLMLLSSTQIPTIMGIVLVILLIARIAKASDESHIAVIHTLSILGLVLAANHIIGLFYYVDRPFVTHSVNLLMQHSANNSFPSTHAMSTMAMALGIWRYYKQLGTLFMGLAILTGISRVFLGFHYPSDVLAGWIITIAIAAVYHTWIASIVNRYFMSTKGFEKLYIIYKRAIKLINESQLPLTKQSLIRKV